MLCVSQNIFHKKECCLVGKQKGILKNDGTLAKLIRRMADKLKLTVLKLERVRIANLSLDDLKSGAYRILSQKEIEKLKRYGHSD